jgi:ribonuclease E
MTKRMLIDATHAEETRVVVMEGNRLVEFDYESALRELMKGNIFLAKVTRVEPSLQAAFVNFGGNRHGFLPFSEIHPDYYRIPVADREAMIAEQKAMEEEAARREAEEEAREEAEFRAISSSEGDPADETYVGMDPEEAAADNYFDVTVEDQDVQIDRIQAGAAQELTAEEVGYVHDEIDLNPRDDFSPDDHAESDGDQDESAEDESSEDDSSDDSQSDEIGDDQEQDAAEDSSESTISEGNGDAGRRRRGRRFGRGRRYMGARRPPRDEIVDDGPAALHARFRRRYKIQEVIKRGQIMLIQVSKEERGNKGAAVTTYLSLPGRYCVLMPNSPRGGGISRKIGNVSDRRRLKNMLRSLEIPSGMSVILRTAGVERDENDIKRDYEYLLRLWDNIRNMTLQSSAPALIYEEGDLIKRSIRDIYSNDVSELIVAGEAGYQEARSFMDLLMPDDHVKIQHYKDDKMPLFQRYQVEGQITEIGEPVVQLKSGGYLVINQTEALVAVDVNSGRATKERHIEETALKTNLEAADEVARQLRLRDLGGLVVIDFIDMEDRRNNARVERRLKEALASDRARIQLSRISAFGLLELSRQRLNPSLNETQFQKCPHCHGFGFIRTVDSTAIIALRSIEEEGVRGRAVKIILRITNDVALYILNAKRDMLADIERRYGFKVLIEVDETLKPSEYVVEPVKASVTREDESDDQDEEAGQDQADGEQNTVRKSRSKRRPIMMDGGADENTHSQVDDVESSTGKDDVSVDSADNASDGSDEKSDRSGNRRRGKSRGRRDRRRSDDRHSSKSDDMVAEGDVNDVVASVQYNDAPEPSAPARSVRSEPRGGGAVSSSSNSKSEPTFFVSKRRQAPEQDTAVQMDDQKSFDSDVAETPLDPNAPKKKGWWSRFS